MSEASAEIVPFTGLTKLDIPVERILNRAHEANLKCVVIIGEKEDGEPYFGSSQADGPNVLWHLELAKLLLFKTYQDLQGK